MPQDRPRNRDRRLSGRRAADEAVRSLEAALALPEVPAAAEDLLELDTTPLTVGAHDEATLPETPPRHRHTAAPPHRQVGDPRPGDTAGTATPPRR